MERIPKTLPISDLRFEQTATLDNLTDGPVLLTRQGRPAAVLVDPKVWNRLLDTLEDQEDVILVLKGKLAEAKGEDLGWIEMSQEELQAMIDEPLAA